MSLRASLNKPQVGGVFVGVLIVVAVAVYFMFRTTSPGSASLVLNYTVDDGKTYFQAPAQAAPFDYHGQQAFQVALFRCGKGGKLFVGYLIRYADGARNAVNAAYKHKTMLPTDGMEVKRPGDTQWVATAASTPSPAAVDANASAQATSFNEIRMVKCPDGNYATQLFDN